MTGSTDPNPFKDGKDPLVPETVRVDLGGGIDGIDLLATFQNHREAMLPQIDSSNMRGGDVLTVEFDTDHQETFDIESVQAGSLVFGSDDVTDRQIRVKRHTEADDGMPSMQLLGSAMTPGGGFRTPGVRVGSYMVTDEGVSTGTIRTFDLKRPDENGELKSVSLNQTEARAESGSFSHAKKVFATLEAMVKGDGFTFGDTEKDKVLPDGFVLQGGTMSRYRKVNGNSLVYAARQGFGCAITPQDEIYVYDAKTQVLRALRNIPTEGVIQMVVVEGVTKAIFQDAGIGYRDGSIPDWRRSWLDTTVLHRMSSDVPVTSYTWLSPDQETPIITVLEDGKNISDLFKTPKKKGAAFVESLEAHGGEDLIDGISQMLGIDPHDEAPIYDRLEVNIEPGSEQPIPRVDGYLWPSLEAASAFADKVEQASTVTYDKDYANLVVDGHRIRIRTDTGRDIDKMVKTAKLAIGTTPRAIGHRLLRGLRPRR